MVPKELQSLQNNLKTQIVNADLQQAEHVANELLSLLENSKHHIDSSDAEQYIDDLIEFIVPLRKAGNNHKALSFVERMLVVAEYYDIDNAILKVLSILGLIHNSLSNYPQALEYLQKALAGYEQTDSKLNVARIQGNIAIVYAALSEYMLALEYFNQGLTIQKELGNKQEVAKGIGNIGIIYESMSEYQKAMECYTASLALYEELDMKVDSARVLGNVGNMYLHLSDYQRALECYTKVLEVFETEGMKIDSARILASIGSVYKNMGEYPKALEFYWQALASHRQSGSKNMEASVTGNIGSVYLQLEEYGSALEYFGKSLAINEELGTKSSIAVHKGNIGALFAEKKFEGYDPEKAEMYLLESIAICEEIGANQVFFEICKLLAELYEQEEEYAKALYYHKQYHESEKKVLNDEIKKQAERSAYERKLSEIQHEQDVTEQILYNILPKDIAYRIRSGDRKIVDKYESVSVLFADVVGFTALSQRVSPEQLVSALDMIFNTFDLLAEKHGCEKIKTIGDCYMAVAGLPQRCENHAERLSLLALDMLQAIEGFPVLVEDVQVTMRIGLHSGSVVAGVIGKNKYSYDLWGDAVNTASRMESHGETGKIHVSEEFLKNLVMVENEWLMVNGEWLINVADNFAPFTINQLPLTINHLPFTIIPRGEMDIKGKGKMQTYFLTKENS
ncbi:MAG: tetratricopeptide repeat protein [Ignavibacteria bacterium]|nr:tetratricopeptide repeat protein [Ignavibacteria bacterium]